MNLTDRATGTRRTIILLSFLGAVVVVCVIMLAGFRPQPVSAGRAVFIGDSYTTGTGASSPDRRWASLVARARGWREINLGNGGTGYLATAGPSGCGRPECPNYGGVVAAAVAAAPDVVVVAGGQNDFPAYTADPASVIAAVDHTYAALRQSLPDAELIAVGPSTTGELDPTVRELDAAVRRAAAASGARYISLLDPEPVIVPGMVAADGAHVSDLGHRAIADRVLAGLPR